MTNSTIKTNQIKTPFSFEHAWRYIIILGIYLLMQTGVIGTFITKTLDPIVRNNEQYVETYTPEEQVFLDVTTDTNTLGIISDSAYDNYHQKHEGFAQRIYQKDGYSFIISPYALNSSVSAGTSQTQYLNQSSWLKDDVADEIISGTKTVWENNATVRILVAPVTEEIEIPPFFATTNTNLSFTETTNVLIRSPFYRGLLNFLIYFILFIPMIILAFPPVKADFDILKKMPLQETIKQTVYSFAMMMAANIAVLLLLTVIGYLGYKAPSDAVNEITINRIAASSGYIWMFLAAVIFGPIVEELVFRKAIFGLIPNNIVAVIVSSLVFGLIHVDTELLTGDFMLIFTTGIRYVAAGLAFGTSYVIYKKNIFIPTFAHMINNLLSMVAFAVIFM